MSGIAKLWLRAGVVLVVFWIIAWFLGSALGGSAGEEWLIRALLWVLGLVAAAMVVSVLAKSASQSSSLSPVEDELERAFATSKERLKPTGHTVATLPVVLLLGPEGSTKTSTIVQSGFEPDLLAGEVFRGQTVVPTPSANVWFSQNAVFVEAGGKLLGDSAGWARLIRHIRPQRLAAVFGGRPQAARVAVVCFSCEELVKPGGAQSAVQAAQSLREKLSDVSKRIGVRLPVYVLFTKVDRVPYFAEYVRRFSEEEVREVLGSTLRLVPALAGGSYADREHQRLSEAFERLVQSLAKKRLDLLPREVDPLAQAGTYEFPREFRKIVPAATQFLVELCKPSQLAVSPFLRGFYFSGVRAVVTSDAPAAPRPAAGAGAGQMGATQVFDPQHHAAPAVQAVATPTSRKIPQWLFLNRLFREVILRDRVALGPQAGGSLNSARRAILSGAVALSFLLLLGFMVSFVRNWRLERRVENAGVALAGAVSIEPELPVWETMRQLDGLRREVERLGTFERDGAPLSMRWWLYSGSKLYPAARTFYANKLETLMLETARAHLLSPLRGLGDTPSESSEYGPTYETLKAYLMTTTNPEHMEADFLAPILMERWLNSRAIDADRREAAERQFDFYSRTLCQSHTCAMAANAPAVARATRFLSQFAGAEQIYQRMLGQAAETHPRLQFNATVMGSAPYVANTYEVHGAFTSDGFEFMQDALQDVDRYLLTEDWVMGEQAVMAEERDSLERRLRQLYSAEYMQQWTTYLTSSTIVPYRNVNDAGTKLDQLSGNQSPLLELIKLVSNHTNVDSVLIAAAFQPAHHVVPPGAAALVAESNTQYMTALLNLKESLNRVDEARGDNRYTLADEARGAASDARVAADQLAQSFNIEGQAREVGNSLQRILEEPINLAIRVLPRRPRVVAGAGIIGAVRQFCQAFNRQLAKFPFDPTASEEATLAEMIDMFHPETGDVANLIRNDLSEIVDVRASGVVAKNGATPTPNASLLNFLNRARNVGSALWREGANEPTLAFTVRFLPGEAVPNITFNVDGQTGRYSRTSTATGRFSWIGTRAREALLTGRVAGRDENLLRFDGQWALFNFFYQASDWRRSARDRVIWDIPWQGSNVRVEAEVFFLGQGEPIVTRDYFPATNCPIRAF